MAQEASVTVVKAANPVTGDLSLSTGLTGTVEAADVVYVYAKASGDVTAVHVKAGDMVTAGQVLCEIDTDQVDSARNSLESAQVNLSQAQRFHGIYHRLLYVCVTAFRHVGRTSDLHAL